MPRRARRLSPQLELRLPLRRTQSERPTRRKTASNRINIMPTRRSLSISSVFIPWWYNRRGGSGSVAVERVFSSSARRRAPKPASGNRKRPNYFLALQLKGREIVSDFNSLVDNICQRENRLRQYAVSTAKLHLTLMVMHLRNQSDQCDDLERARRALLSTHNDVRKLLDPHESVTLRVEGLDTFGGRVLYARCNSDNSMHDQDLLHSLRRLMLSAFKKEQIDVHEEQRVFHPHVTVMKLWRTGGAPLHRIDETHWADWRDHQFGIEAVNDVQLCRMEAVDDQGYYVVDETLSLAATAGAVANDFNEAPTDPAV